MYRAAPSRKALTVAFVTPNKPNSRCGFAAVTYTENWHRLRGQSFGVDSSSAMVVFPITEVIRHGMASNDHTTPP